ncbi:aspartate/glutamate racemase family protein [Thalassotalea castellviae]|uniref:Aspartate/glutamate racemase family protein n=1 Tax=Thalassotalea castellviae TaxID=3075612 RepID=A0ABU3A3P4_9GAMM|nr:aspartate/glutamate racemase family protein [Thalassotalea sp. W431]MDT0604794.1 aspartate/glutamate racemase family protein [Thalassotalea sp. W431]
MKTIGLLAGMSWESSLSYYRVINQGVNTALGGLHSAKIAMVSVDFQPIEQLQHSGEWQKTAELLITSAKQVQAAGADFLLICTNTMHKVAAEIENAIDIPLLHIADATAEVIIKKSLTTVGLLGTAFTMEQGFYKNRLTEKFGIKVITPNEQDRMIVHDVIYQELCLGKVNLTSKNEYLRIIQTMADQGAQAVILGCTEIGMLVEQADTRVTLLDTTTIHGQKAIEFALKDEQ